MDNDMRAPQVCPTNRGPRAITAYIAARRHRRPVSDLTASRYRRSVPKGGNKETALLSYSQHIL